MIQRRQILIDRTFQHRLAIDLMVIVLIVPAVLWADFYILGQYALSRNPDVGQASGWGLIGTLFKQQWFFMLAVFALNFGLVYAFVIYYTHRIAGPVYRFCRTFDDMAEGKLAQRIKLRKKDYFENLGESINRLSENLCSSLAELKTRTSALATRAQALNDSELKKQVAELEQLLAHYEIVLAPRSPDAVSDVASKQTMAETTDSENVRAES